MWLNDIGLELKPSKTRIAHTLEKDKSEDGIAGFNFLGYNIRQFPTGKYNSATKGSKAYGNIETIGFKTLITPSKDSSTVSDRRGKLETATSTLSEDVKAIVNLKLPKDH